MITLDNSVGLTDYGLTGFDAVYSYTNNGSIITVFPQSPFISNASLVSPISGVTYNGIPLKFCVGQKGVGFYYLLNAPIGTHDVIVTFGLSNTGTIPANCAIVIQSYNNVLSVGAKVYSSVGGFPGGISNTLTTTADNSLVLGMFASDDYVGISVPGGTTLVANAHQTSNAEITSADSGVITSSGTSTTITINFSFAPHNAYAGGLELREIVGFIPQMIII